MNEHKLSKIEHHPDKNEIVSRLSSGESVRSIYKWLSGKYGKYSTHLKVSIPTIQLFRKEVLKIEGDVLKKIQDEKRKLDLQLEAQYVAQTVQGTNAYVDKINQIASSHLDVSAKMLQMDAIIGDRLEYWFNVVKAGTELPQKADYELRKYIDQQVLVLQQYRKLVEGMADKKIDYNVNITVMNEQIQSIQTVIRELICEELGPEKAISFIDKLSNRLSGSTVKELPGKITEAEFKVTD